MSHPQHEKNVAHSIPFGSQLIPIVWIVAGLLLKHGPSPSHGRRKKGCCCVMQGLLLERPARPRRQPSSLQEMHDACVFLANR